MAIFGRPAQLRFRSANSIANIHPFTSRQQHLKYLWDTDASPAVLRRKKDLTEALAGAAARGARHLSEQRDARAHLAHSRRWSYGSGMRRHGRTTRTRTRTRTAAHRSPKNTERREARTVKRQPDRGGRARNQASGSASARFFFGGQWLLFAQLERPRVQVMRRRAATLLRAALREQ